MARFETNVAKVRPKYQVVPIARTMRVNTAEPVYEVDVKGERRRRWVFKPQNVECRGFMVYFPRGHSIFVESANRLRELGFDAPPDMVNMDTGDVVQMDNVMDLRTQGEALLNSEQPVSVIDDLDEDIRQSVNASPVVDEKSVPPLPQAATASDLLGPPEQKTRP